ncbi:MAG: methyltransferase domain-containing protein [Oceanicaulis sp.]
MSRNNYKHIADEYYDSMLHPTCHLLGLISYRFLSCAVSTSEHQLIVEVAAGKGLPIYSKFPKLISTDKNFEMMIFNRNSEKIVCDAISLPFSDSSIDIVIGGLIDPFNKPDFFSEVYRVLRPGGLLFFTVPSFLWASNFRAKNEMNVAKFLYRENQNFDLDSYIYDVHVQKQILNSVGFASTSWSPLYANPNDPEAPKLDIARSCRLPIVDGYSSAKLV